MDINSFFLNNKSIDLLNNWVNYDYKNKFLFIYGNVSSGKTSLAEILLKNYKIININIDFFKEKTSLTDFLNLSLGKKNISMMFIIHQEWHLLNKTPWEIYFLKLKLI